MKIPTQISLRKFLLCFAALTTLLAIIAIQHQRCITEWHKEQQALEVLPWPHHGYTTIRVVPLLLQPFSAFLDRRYFERVVSYEIRYSYLGQQEFEALQQLTELRNLDLESTEGVSDSTFVYVTKLRNLESLVVTDNDISDKALPQLQAFPNLHEFHASGLLITDQGVQSILHSCPRLETLSIASTRITDESMKTIGKFSKLRELNIRDTLVSDKGMLELHGLRKLQRLFIEETVISMNAIRKLKLANSKITIIGEIEY